MSHFEASHNLRPLFPNAKIRLKPYVERLAPRLKQSSAGRALLEGLIQELNDCHIHLQKRKRGVSKDQHQGPSEQPELSAQETGHEEHNMEYVYSQTDGTHDALDSHQQQQSLANGERGRSRRRKRPMSQQSTHRSRVQNDRTEAHAQQYSIHDPILNAQQASEFMMSGGAGFASPRSSQSISPHSQGNINALEHEKTPVLPNREDNVINAPQSRNRRRRKRSPPLPPPPKFSFKKNIVTYLKDCIKYEVAAREKEARRSARKERRRAKQQSDTIGQENPIRFGHNSRSSAPHYIPTPHSNAVEAHERQQQSHGERPFLPAVASTDDVSAAWEEAMPLRRPPSTISSSLSDSRSGSTKAIPQHDTAPSSPSLYTPVTRQRRSLGADSTRAVVSPRPSHTRHGHRPRSCSSILMMPDAPSVPDSSIAGRILFPSMQQHFPPLSPSKPPVLSPAVLSPLGQSQVRRIHNNHASARHAASLPPPIPTYLDNRDVSLYLASRTKHQCEQEQASGRSPKDSDSCSGSESLLGVEQDNTTANRAEVETPTGYMGIPGFDAPGWGWGNAGHDDEAVEDTTSESSNSTDSEVRRVMNKGKSWGSVRGRGIEGQMEEGRARR